VNPAPPGASTPPSEPAEKPPIAIVVIVWLLIQLAALALAASGVPLSANFPKPPQSLAVHEMLIAQFVGSAMLLPLLFRARGWRAWLAMVISAGPMLMLAARLTPMSMSHVLVLWLEVAAWLTMLALWRAVVPRDAGSMLAAIAMLLSAGGLLVAYLAAEFQPDRRIPLIDAFPLLATLQSMRGPAPDLSPLRSTVALSSAALVILAVKTLYPPHGGAD
jgi:hypothetical protein